MREQLDTEDLLKYKICTIHAGETIKYYCRDDKTALCGGCVIDHAKHNFIFADEEATSIIK